MTKSDKIQSSYVRLDEAMLQPGDIILVTQSTKMSAAIRIATWSDISHAMVYVEDRSVIDATPEGVQAGNTQRLLLEASRPVHVLRLKEPPSAQQLEHILLDLRGKIGTRYSEGQAKLAVVPARLKAGRQQFCSRLVAQAFASAGIRLVSRPDFCTPGSLRRSRLLTEIVGATLPVSEAELEIWDRKIDLPQLMRDATNALLGGAREIAPHIETFDDLNEMLALHPEHDQALCDILTRSRYLEIWEIERANNPWQYTLEAMRLEPDDAMRDYCWSVLNNETRKPNRFTRNRAGYDTLARRFDRAYFRAMVGLYDTLASIHAQRVDVARRWLEAMGDLPAFEASPLTPHSQAWFEALRNWNPAQAQMTKWLIDRTGRADICSICGDDPAADYRLAPDQRPPGGTDTLRLCEDCLEIRCAAGEHFQLLTENARYLEKGIWIV